MVAVVGSVMSVALIIANVLALVVPELTEGKSQEPTEGTESTTRESERLCLGWLPCVPLMVALALVASGTLREGTSQKPQQRERNRNEGIATFLPCGSVMVVAPIAATPLPLVGCHCRKRPRMPKGVAVALMVVASIDANVLALMPCVPLMVARCLGAF